jgi:hypothetical protein
MAMTAAGTISDVEIDAAAAAEADPSARSLGRGRYLYAIIDHAADGEPLGFTGVDAAPVYAIGDGRVAAVVSDSPDRRVRPERRKLAAHHDVLKRLMADHAVLPMAFGLIADGPDAVRRILRLNARAFDDQLERVRGKVEMGLRVAWDVPNIFEYATAIHAELAELRDRIFRGGREPSQDDKIELGRAFDRLMTEDREAHVDRVTRALAGRCVEITTNKPRDEREVMNLACLVDRDRLEDFELGVVESARGFDHNFAFDYNGPWPPHNFVEIDLRMS